MRPVSAALVLDAAILVSAARGRSRDLLTWISRSRQLVTTERAFEETRRRILLGMQMPELANEIDLLRQDMEVTPAAALVHLLPPAETALREAVPSRNGSVRDAHILALAWAADADVWSTDRDFAGTGVATWSTPNLIRALAEAGGL